MGLLFVWSTPATSCDPWRISPDVTGQAPYTSDLLKAATSSPPPSVYPILSNSYNGFSSSPRFGCGPGWERHRPGTSFRLAKITSANSSFLRRTPSLRNWVHSAPRSILIYRMSIHVAAARTEYAQTRAIPRLNSKLTRPLEHARAAPAPGGVLRADPF